MSVTTSPKGTPDVPEPIALISELMSGYGHTWSLCGGWAVDAWLGRVTREHGDIDVSVFAGDQRALFEHLEEWQLLAHDATWEPNDVEVWWDGQRRLNNPCHIHARPPERAGAAPKGGIATAEDGFTIEFYIDALSGDEWVLRKEPHVAVPLSSAVQPSAWGVPVAAPEVLLFFKAAGEPRIRLRDHLDFVALLPQLDSQQRDWLRDAIERLGHPWLGEFSRVHSEVSN